MNYAMIIYLLGKIMEIIGAMMLCPFVVSIIYHERSGIYFIACGAVTLALGSLICRFSPCIRLSDKWRIRSRHRLRFSRQGTRAEQHRQRENNAKKLDYLSFRHGFSLLI